MTGAVTIVRPGIGPYSSDMLRYEEIALPPLAAGEVAVRVVYLSLDPTNRNWLKLQNSSTIIGKVGVNLRVGGVMMGQVLGVVEDSRSPDFRAGDLVAALAGWQERIHVPAEHLRPISLRAGEPLTAWLSLFSHVGLAALTGLRDVLDVRAGETLLVSGAAGATGSLVVEMARHYGARVIGIAGGPEKCRRVREWGADGVIDYKAEDVAAALVRLCPAGVDAFFDNVGGAVMDAALPHMAMNGRIAICGVMADYDLPAEQVRGIRNMYHVLIKALRIEGFLASRSGRPVDVQLEELRGLFAAGVIHDRHHVVRGLAGAPAYLAMLFSGANDGKLIVEVSPPPGGLER